MNISNFYLHINLNETKHNKLLEDLAASKIRLPNLMGIRIGYISDADINTRNFLKDCIPVKLQMLWINYGSILPGIKSTFYLNSIMTAAGATTKEIYLGPTVISEDDLQSIVKAASHVERLIFSHCSIHCSSTLNFGSVLKYNIKILSFQSWGRTNSEITTDWKKNESWFENIVNAIAGCGLKTSLKKLNIYENPTLKTAKLQNLFIVKGISRISIIEEKLEPLK